MSYRRPKVNKKQEFCHNPSIFGMNYLDNDPTVVYFIELVQPFQSIALKILNNVQRVRPIGCKIKLANVLINIMRMNESKDYNNNHCSNYYHYYYHLTLCHKIVCTNILKILIFEQG